MIPWWKKATRSEHFACKAHFMSHADHGHTLFGQQTHGIENFAYKLGIECGGGLIKQHVARFHCQRTGDGKALLLTT